MTEKYHLPDEVIKHHEKYMALIGLRDVFAKLPFGYKKAAKAAIGAEQAKTIFWGKVVAIYPELKGKLLSFSITGGVKCE